MILAFSITDAETDRVIAEVRSTISAGYRGAPKVTTYPLEKGGFFSANKVASPFELPMQVALQGTPAQLRAILADLQRYERGVELVNVVMPVATFLNCNLIRLNWDMKEGGSVGVLQLDLGFLEIRIIDATYTTLEGRRPAQVSNKSDASTEERGRQQAPSATPVQRSAIAEALGL